MKPKASLGAATARTFSSLTLLAAVCLAACSPSSPESQVKAAQKAIQDGDPLAAALNLKSALQAKPDDKEIRFQLGQLLLAGGDAVGAELELRKAGELGVDAAAVQPLIARALLDQGKPEAVIRAFAAIDLPAGAADAAIKATLAEAYSNLGKRDEALKLLKQALESDPRSVPARLLEVRRLLADDQLDAAKSILAEVMASEPRNVTGWLLQGDLDRRLSTDPVAPLAAYKKAHDADRYSVPAHVAYLRALFAAKQLNEVERQLKAFKTVFPRHPQVLFFTALLAFERGQLDVARETTVGLLKVAPNAPLALQLAGAIELRRGNLLLAASQLGRAVAGAPTEPSPRLLLARTALLQRDYARALSTLQPLLEEKSPSPQAMAIAGEALLQSGDMRKAALLLDSAAKANPQDMRTRSALALSRIDSGNLSEGLDELRKLTEIDTSTTADLALVSSLFARQRWDEALQAVEVLERKAPKSPEPANLRGRIELARGDVAKARAAFTTALERDPAFLEAANKLVELDIADGKPSEAVKRFEAVVAARPTGLAGQMALWQAKAATGQPLKEQAATLANLVRAHPEEAAPRLALIRVQAQNREFGLALTSVQSALSQFPDHPELLDALAQLQMQAGQWQQAMASVNRLLARDPASVIGLMRMAELQARQGDLKASQQHLRKVLSVDPSYVPALRTLVDMEVSAGNIAAGRQMVEAHQKLRPRDPELLILRGDLEQTQKQWRAAIGYFHQALALRPTALLASKVHRALVAGSLQSDADRFATDWLRQNPRDPQFRRYLGDLALSQGQLPTAERWYREILKLRPADASTLNNLAWLLLKKAPAEALQHAKRAVEFQPIASHYDTLADAHAAADQWKLAVEAQRTALSLDPDNAVLAMRLARKLHRSGDRNGALEMLKKVKPGPLAGVSEVEVERLRQEIGTRESGKAAS
jgi:putative PEP-CTERM system TPR-repeat lipoprotein